MEQALNEQFLTPGTCFGCGLANPDGLHLRVYRDGARTDRLVGRWTPRPTHGGFPSIVHGGLQFTVLDCMAAWIVLVLRNPGARMPLTKSASMRYLRPARIGGELHLASEVTKEAATDRDPLVLRCELRDAAGELLSEGEFEYVALPADRFVKAVGLDELPEAYRHHFGRR